ncbi:MAG TPA: ATP-binding protein [Rhodocyclaceae bacterium]|jgi:two-component system sensor histidine kinase FlrB|nr:ATP-binding protein [Rhodocyclaceae bacterium]
MPLQATEASRATDQAAHLAEAFRVFNQASAELSEAYAGLRGQVAQLTAELAAANGELARQYQEKAALNERLARLLDALPAGVVVVDGGGRVEQSNPAADAILGANLAGADWARVAERVFEGSDTQGEWRSRGPSAAEKRVTVSETPLSAGSGRIVLLQDVTETHRMRRQAQRHERLAAMGEMAASLAHQLRTPLSAALLYVGNLASPALAVPERIGMAEKASARLQDLERMIRDMLVFARGEVSGREWFAAADLAAEALQCIEPLARERGVVVERSDGAAGARLHGDRKALAGALVNLLENAVQACAPGCRVRLALTAAGGQLAFTVRDNGTGIAAPARERLFEPFFSTRSGGTGLGLAVARGIARAHGGRLDLVAADGPGTEFALYLPCAGAEAASAAQTQ